MKKSNFLKVNARDLLRAGVTAAVTTLIAGGNTVFQFGNEIGWQQIKNILLCAGWTFVSYIILNLFTNSKGQIKPDEPKL
jgi:hypothetical protein